MAELRIKTGHGWPVGGALLASQHAGTTTQVYLDDEVVAWIVPDSVFSYQREQIGELTAEVARLKAEIDSMEATYKTVHVTALNLQMAMVICKDEEAGTVLRETDGQRRDYVLGEDRQWTTR